MYGTEKDLDNEGYFKSVNGKKNDELGSNEFLTEDAKNVYNLTASQLNTARNLKAGTYTYALKEREDYSSFKSYIYDSNDAAKGLFLLKSLNDYGYSEEAFADIQYGKLPYSLASSYTGYLLVIWQVDFSGSIFNTYGDYGVRPV